MTSTWRQCLTALVAAMFASLFSPACEVDPEMLEDQRILSAYERGECECEAMAAQARETAEGPTATWPEGWMVVHHEDWIPVLDELGRRLHAARRAFQNGDRMTASTEVRDGLVFLEALVSDANARDLAAIERAIATLWVIADRLSDGEDVTLRQLDTAFANAYLSDLEREALVVETDSAVPYLERPETHLERAVELFLMNEPEKAASEIDRAAAYLYLEGNRLGLGERAELNKAAQDLEHVAARVRFAEIRECAEFDSVFEPARQQWHQHAVEPARPRLRGSASQ